MSTEHRRERLRLVRRRSLLTPRFILICVSGTLYFFAFSLPLSVLPIWVETELGGTSTQIGISVGISVCPLHC